MTRSASAIPGNGTPNLGACGPGCGWADRIREDSRAGIGWEGDQQ